MAKRVERSEWQAAAYLMADRGPDVPYTAARFVGIAASHIPGSHSLGIWENAGPLTPDQTHGDFGIVRVNVRDWSCECAGGYGLDDFRGIERSKWRKMSLDGAALPAASASR